MSATMTLALWREKSLAVRSPMRLAPPMISATFPSSLQLTGDYDGEHGHQKFHCKYSDTLREMVGQKGKKIAQLNYTSTFIKKKKKAIT